MFQNTVGTINRINHAMDRLTTLLNHFSLHAVVFYTGNICGVHDYGADTLSEKTTSKRVR